jgi:tetratricopeptide (TPR) repeat protein
MTDLLATAVEHHRQGRLEQAGTLYRQALEAEPDNPEALHLLGLLSHQCDDNAEAARLIRRAIEVNPGKALYHFNLGLVLSASGDAEGAADAYRAALAHDPGFADAHNNLGLLLEARGERQSAARSFQSAVAAVPQHVEAQANLARHHLAADEPAPALEAFERVLALDASLPEAHFGRGRCLEALNKPGQAETAYRQAIALHAGYAEALRRLGALLMRTNRASEAAEIFRRGHELHPSDPRFAASLAKVLEALNDLEGAEAAAKQALSLEPNSSTAQFVLARLDFRHDRFADAGERLRAMLADPLSDAARTEALFELGLVLDQLGESADAFAAFTEANAMRSRSEAARRFDGNRFLARVEANRAWFTRERLQALAARAPAAEEAAPVFFVGFPRSGTTLMERALEAHPRIVTTNERSPLARVLKSVLSEGGHPAVLENWPEERLSEARARFWSEADSIVGPRDGRILVDKLPLNIVDLGFANVLFPEARVVVALRDPRDVCLSCFMQFFRLNDPMANFLELDRTARTYAAVMNLWLSYRAMLTLPWHEYRYEDLVDDFEGVVRGVLEFMDLAWHDDVTRFRELTAQQARATPSYRQVTRDLYKGAVGRWHAYHEELAPVLPVLAPIVAEFGYSE